MNSINRPKIHIPKSTAEKIADIIGYAALLLMFCVIALSWPSLPVEIPAHFGASGEVDRWGSKYELLILPGIALFLHIFLLVFEKFPETHNYPTRFNEENAAIFYLNSRETLNYMRNIINILFAYTVWMTVSIAKGAEAHLGWPFFAILALLFIVLIWKIVKVFNIK